MSKPARNRLHLTGKIFGRLTVLRLARVSQQRSYWKCRCRCGTVLVVDGGNLRSGHSSSCGCARRETLTIIKTTHGQTNSPTYFSYRCMLNRCFNANWHAYSRYGGRGITVCKRWLGKRGFINFIADMGERPSKKHTLERNKNNSGYSPKNCCWLLSERQAANKGNTIYVVLKGKKIRLQTACDLYKVPYDRCLYRRNMGWRHEDIFSVPAFGKPNGRIVSRRAA